MEFYGKTCNYAFPYRKEGYEAFFLGDKGMAEYKETFKDIDSCILWGVYQEFEEANTDIGSGNMLICESGTMRPAMWITSRDSLLKYAWLTLTDVNIDEEEHTEQDWFLFPAGTGREEIWFWFDEHYSRGIGGLMGCSIDCPALS